MNRVLRLLRRIALASPHELWSRSSQVLFAVRNYSGMRSGRSALSAHGHLRSLRIGSEGVVQWWNNRRTQWFVNDAVVRSLKANANNDESELPWILQKANDVLDDRIPLFSYGTFEYLHPQRWHQDVVLDKTAPPKFHGQVRYLDPNEVGDSKHVWEPNRFAWAIWLGIAYQVTGNSEYANKFRRWTLDWFQSNPYPIGINYCSALELAYRNYAWLWSLSLFRDFLETQEDLLERLLWGLWTATRHVEENLSLYFAPNTHILGEAFGLFAVGAAIPEFSDAPRWRSLGLRLLETEAQKQFHQDGMHRELSSGYHIYATDIYLQTVRIGQESGFRVPVRVEETARRAARRLAELAPLDLLLPQFNDCDGGRLINMVPEALDAGPSLMCAEDLFNDESFLVERTVKRGYALLFDTTGTVAEDNQLRREHLVQTDRDLYGVYDSGLATYRTNGGDYCLLRGSSFGYMDCPHSHDAPLGVLLNLGHTPIFVDSGVGSYTQSKEVRDRFRSASGKNTLLVDGDGPSEPDDWFSWKRKTNCQLVAMKRFRDGFMARAKHDGFSHPPHSHTFVSREIIMLDIGIIAIVDRWDSDHDIQVETRFTLNPDLELNWAQKLLRSPKHQVFHFDCFSLNIGEDLEFVNNDEGFSPDYGLVTKTNAISFRHRHSRRGGLVTFVSRCGPVGQRSSEGSVVFGQNNIVFEVTSKGVTYQGLSPVDQLN